MVLYNSSCPTVATDCYSVPPATLPLLPRRGLRWNLEQTEMRFGGLVSTSNLLEADEVHVESDADLIWTTQLHDPVGSSGGSDSEGRGGGGGGGGGGSQ
jgi:uncharacterized membrane protein YgcG